MEEGFAVCNRSFETGRSRETMRTFLSGLVVQASGSDDKKDVAVLVFCRWRKQNDLLIALAMQPFEIAVSTKKSRLFTEGNWHFSPSCKLAATVYLQHI